ncbi:MAG: hypothetical protein JNM26_17670 [Ideonella sp.]|nr:hypothetical protein [Ideonella sp.]
MTMQARKVLPRVVAPLLVAVMAAGCATPYHHSQLVGARYFQVPIHTYPVAVVRVDDASTPLHGPVLVEPGLRRVVVQTGPSLVRSLGEQRVIELQVAPCTRYYLVADKVNSLATDFVPRVDPQEPVPGCTAPRG